MIIDTAENYLSCDLDFKLLALNFIQEYECWPKGGDGEAYRGHIPKSVYDLLISKINFKSIHSVSYIHIKN